MSLERLKQKSIYILLKLNPVMNLKSNGIYKAGQTGKARPRHCELMRNKPGLPGKRQGNGTAPLFK